MEGGTSGGGFDICCAKDIDETGFSHCRRCFGGGGGDGCFGGGGGGGGGGGVKIGSCKALLILTATGDASGLFSKPLPGDEEAKDDKDEALL